MTGEPQQGGPVMPDMWFTLNELAERGVEVNTRDQSWACRDCGRGSRPFLRLGTARAHASKHAASKHHAIERERASREPVCVNEWGSGWLRHQFKEPWTGSELLGALGRACWRCGAIEGRD